MHRPTRVAIAVTDNDGAVRDPFDERHCGLDHLAFAVANPDVLHEWSNSLEQHGIPHSAVTDSGSGHHLNLLAPGGTPIELYASNAASVAAFGTAGPEEAFAGSGGAP